MKKTVTILTTLATVVAIAAGILATPAPASAYGKRDKARMAEAEARAAAMRKADDDRRAEDRAAHNARNDARKAKAACEKNWPKAIAPSVRTYEGVLKEASSWMAVPKLAVPTRATFDSAWSQARKGMEAAAKLPASEKQIATVAQFLFLVAIAPLEVEGCAPIDIEGTTQNAEAVRAHVQAVINLHVAAFEKAEAVRVAEAAAEAKLDAAHDRKIFAALKRAGAKTNTVFYGINEAIEENGFDAVRGRAVWVSEPCQYVPLQIVAPGKALFTDIDGDEYNECIPILVTGIATRNLILGSSGLDELTEYVIVKSLKTYTNLIGGQGQAVVARYLKPGSIPPFEREE